MMSKKTCRVIRVTIIAVAIVIIGAALCHINAERHSPAKRIFNDFSYLGALNKFEYVLLDGGDKNLDGLETDNAVNASINYEGTNIILHAYEFKSNEEAFEYFKRCYIKSNIEQKKCFYFQKSGLLGTDFVAYYENYAYRLEGGSLVNFINFIDSFTKDFPIDISEEYYNTYGIKMR